MTMKSGKTFIHVIVIAFPLLLIGMVIVGMLLYEQRRVDKVAEHPRSQQVTTQGIVANYTKLRDFMSPRGFENPQQLQKLVMTTSFIDGSVSPINTGMSVSSEIVRKEAGRVWKNYVLEFKGKGEEKQLKVNYLESSNAELAVALAIAEALPNQELNSRFEIEFSPVGESSVIADWVKEATLRGVKQPLYEDGIDWTYLKEQIRDYIESL